MSFGAPSIQMPAVPQAPPPPVLASSPQGQKPKKKGNTPSMIGTGLNDPAQGTNPFGGKTLLGE